MLTLTRVSHVLADTQLFSDINCSLGRGQCLAITGPNGAGKSTLLQLIAGIMAPASGTITFNRRTADESDPAFRQHISSYLGHDSTFPELTVYEHLRLLAVVRGAQASAVDALVVGAGITPLRDRFPHTLSAGQRQRFDLCAAFLPNATLTIVDEPEAGLDDAGIEWFIGAVSAVCRDGRSVVMATHSRDIVDSCADAELVIPE